MGAEGSVAAVTVELPQASVLQIKSLWLQIHGLEYLDLASVRVNHGLWVSLNNQSVTEHNLVSVTGYRRSLRNAQDDLGPGPGFRRGRSKTD
jgi:hypothetical protein